MNTTNCLIREKIKEDNKMPPKMPPSPLIVNVGGTYNLTC